jgi:thioredoxin 1
MIVYTLKNSNDFIKLLELSNTRLLILDFTAEAWCAPCRQLSKLLKDLPDNDNIYIVKIDIDEFGDIANKFDITSVPTLVFVKSSIVQKVINGVPDMQKMIELINNYV